MIFNIGSNVLKLKSRLVHSADFIHFLLQLQLKGKCNTYMSIDITQIWQFGFKNG